MTASTLPGPLVRSTCGNLDGGPRYRRPRSVRRPLRRLVCEGLEDRTVPTSVGDTFGSIPMSFEANQGQADTAVQFLSRGPGYGLSLTATEAVLTLDGSPPGQDVGPQQASGAEIRMQVVGASPSVGASGQERLPGVVNYFIGSDPALWRTNVPTFGRVEYDGVYPGIDLVYYGNQQQLEYDFVVEPGADPSSIRLAFRGAERISLDAQGNLILHTAGGDVVQHAPVLYQQGSTGRTPVEGSFRLEGNQVTFDVGNYDTGRPLVIDPVLSYSTYLGGMGFDAGFAIAVDAAGSAYVTGQTGTVDFPTTAGAFRTSLGDTNNAAFITKLNPSGTGLVYSTYLGGGALGHTVGYGIAVDAGGNAYVTGETLAVDFPTTAGAFQWPEAQGWDVFVTKLNPQGNGLVYSVRYGGQFDDFGRGIAVDADGRAVVTGWLMNENLPGIDAGFPTVNAFQPHYGGGFVDAFVTKFSADGSSLLFSTYLGGPSFSSDWGQAVATDAVGNSYVTGHTYARDFPTTPGAFQRDGAVGLDAFVTKFTPTGEVAYSTHAIGGSGHDEAWGIAVDGTGNAYVTGNTDSWDDPDTTINTGFPTTPGAFRRTLVGQIDAFVAKLNPSGSALVYGTYLGGNSDFGGGSGMDRGFGIAVDAAGSAYVVGDTESPNFPVVNPIQTFNYWYTDAFVTKLNPSGSALEYSTYLGGELTDSARGVAVDSAGNAYVAGLASSFEFPTTAGAFQPANAGGIEHHDDAFVARIGGAIVTPPSSLPGLSIADVSRSEGHQGTTQVTFTVGLTSATSQAVTVAYATADGTATAGGDYSAVSGTLTIPAGQTMGTITVLVHGDRRGEANETFFVNLNGATNAAIVDGQAVGTILDDEPRVTISDVTMVEGRKGQKTLFVFTVTLSTAYDQPVTLSYRTVAGTARASDNDYAARTGTLTFQPGETTRTITIEVRGDNKREGNEYFYLDLFGLSSNALFTRNRGIGTILNDD